MSGGFIWWLRFLNPTLSLLVHSVVLATFSFLSVGSKTRLSAIQVSSEACAVGPSTGPWGEVLEHQFSSLPWEKEASWVHKDRPSLESLQSKGRLFAPLPNICADSFIHSPNIYESLLCAGHYSRLTEQLKQITVLQLPSYWRETHREPYILIRKLYVL